MRLIDSHAHLQDDAFEVDAAEVLAAARVEGVERILVPGWDVASSRESIAYVEGKPRVDATAGAHPHVATTIDDGAWDIIATLARDPAVVAVGETGLDYDRAFSPRDDQLANLRRHIALALELRKPLILHCRSKPGQRDAQDDLVRELTDGGIAAHSFGDRPAAVLHSFSGPVDYAERALELGCAISFSGLVFRKGEEASAEVARITPGDRFLVETDSPYLSPPGAPRRRNEPLWVKVTATWLADRRGERPHALGDALVANYDRIFSSEGA
jgi:TatD DNase family protein